MDTDAVTLSVPGTDLLTFAFEGHGFDDQNKPIYIDAEHPDRWLNAIQTKTLVRKLVAGFRTAGLQPGDCVVVILANSFLYSSLYFSIIGAGGVYFGVNPASQSFELSHALKLGEPKLIVTSSDVLPNILRTPEASAYSPKQIFVLDSKSFPLSAAHSSSLTPPSSETGTPTEEEPRRHTNFLNLTYYGESDWIRINDTTTARSTPAAMFSTSGTSGLPKAAVSSHYALVSQHLSMEAPPSYEVSRLISLPFFHLFAADFAHVFPIRLGQPLYILPRFQLHQYVSAIQQFHITDTVMAPPIVHTLNKCSMNLPELLDSIRWIGVGGAPIAADAMQTFRRNLHSTATLSQVWGMTEIGVATLVRYPEQHCDGSIGRALPGYETRLMDSFGDEVLADHEPGELQVRYDGMMIGYKNQSIHERGDWYTTGDIMTRVEGKFYVVGRSIELIKVNGWQVPPAELEAVLLQHSCVNDAGVIGVLRDDGVTEMPRAYVVRKGDTDGRCSTLSAEEIYEFTRSRLASYKALNGGIFFVDYIPRTASGKIQRFKLAQMDNYRRSVTELLVQNNTVIAEQKREKVAGLKAKAEERRIATRRSSRSRSSSSASSLVSNYAGSEGVSKSTQPRRRSRVSLIEKMKTLEASRMDVGESGTVLPLTTS